MIDVSDVETAIVNHDDKKIEFKCKSGFSATVSFDDYDEWGSVTLEDRLVDYQILFDEILCVAVYGLKLSPDAKYMQCDMDDEHCCNILEIGEFEKGTLYEAYS